MPLQIALGAAFTFKEDAGLRLIAGAMSFLGGLALSLILFLDSKKPKQPLS
jgi:hypothetical protein